MAAKIITIATEYQSTSCKADQVLVIRPGTDTALALGLAHVILRDNLYGRRLCRKSFTDLPFLVRMDTLKLLSAADVFLGYRAPALENYVQVLKPDDKTPPNFQQGEQLITEAQRKTWGDFVVWDARENAPAAVTRNHVGQYFAKLGIAPALEGTFEARRRMASKLKCVRFRFGKSVLGRVHAGKCVSIDLGTGRRLFSRWPTNRRKQEGDLARARHGAESLFQQRPQRPRDFPRRRAHGQHRLPRRQPSARTPATTEPRSLTRMGQYICEDSFNIKLDPDLTKAGAYRYKDESAHYYNYGERPFRLANKIFTGKTHMPTPTKSTRSATPTRFSATRNGAYDVIVNTLPKTRSSATSGTGRYLRVRRRRVPAGLVGRTANIPTCAAR